jgi:hypothetical protein
MKSCVLIVPLAYHAAANQLAELMGWGPNSYSVPLSASGPATHYGLHAWVTPEFEAMIAGAGQGEMPEALVQAGYPLATFLGIMGSLISSIRDSIDGHWQEVLDANGLEMVQADD